MKNALKKAKRLWGFRGRLLPALWHIGKNYISAYARLLNRLVHRIVDFVPAKINFRKTTPAETEQEVFHSGFKTWIRAVAFLW